MPTLKLPDKLSALIEQQLPAYVRSDHEMFQTFLEAYYKWLELEKNSHYLPSTQTKASPRNILKNLMNLNDIDETLDEYVDYLAKEFMLNIPKSVITDKRTLLKYIKQFYQAKGSEKSYKLIFRILYNLTCDFYYPKNDVIRASHGTWSTKQILRVDVANEDSLYNLEGVTIVGNTSDASAVIERVVKLYTTVSTSVLELILTNISGTFLINEDVTINSTITGSNIYGILNSTQITDPKQYFYVGDSITVVGSGTGADVVVNKVTSGPIDEIKILAGGSGYYVGDSLIFSSGSAEGTVLSVIVNQYIDQESSTDEILLESGDYLVTEEHQEGTSGAITSIDLVYGGDYEIRPTIAVNTEDDILTEAGDTLVGESSNTIIEEESSQGSGASLLACGENIGSIKELRISDFGINYDDNIIYEDGDDLQFEDGINGIYQDEISLESYSYLLMEDGDTITTESGEDLLEEEDAQIGNGFTGIIGMYPKYYINRNGQPSEDKFIFDGEYYQEFSYVLMVTEYLNKYKEAIKRLVHPAGLKMFGRYNHLSSTNNLSTKIDESRMGIA